MTQPDLREFSSSVLRGSRLALPPELVFGELLFAQHKTCTDSTPLSKTWLASYFVCVDTTLVVQYFYYTQSAQTSDLHKLGYDRTTSISQPRIPSERTPSQYRTISAVAANVAAAAALVAQQDEQAQIRREAHRQRRNVDQSFDVTNIASVEENEEETHVKLTESYHSEGGRTSKRKRVSWSVERPGVRGGSVGPHAASLRPSVPSALSLNVTESPTAEAPSGVGHQRPIRSATEITNAPRLPSRRNSRASRRGASLVFLGIWALFGIGNYTNVGKHVSQPNHEQGIGKVLTAPLSIVPSTIPTKPPSQALDRFSEPETIVVFGVRKASFQASDFHLTKTSNEQFLGRIFAWLCTTLYLTSRLPQIWKNYVRKSVEGLSMSLFVFAFLGNVCYVASILSSPKAYQSPPLSTEFIRESIPYLLGSAGTLMFDITIVAQSFIYRPRRHRHSIIDDSVMTEETGLLSATDALMQPPYHTNDHPPRGRTLHINTAG
ncbi:hypothetical protein AX17_003486 [Amanita inopinata Kibby_2008]|nr:hypothetical protein AX17_003486 [Amanita inopinata Kibby_2008]